MDWRLKESACVNNGLGNHTAAPKRGTVARKYNPARLPSSVSPQYAPRSSQTPYTQAQGRFPASFAPHNGPKKEEERERVAANRQVSRLWKKHQRNVAANASMTNIADRQEANFETDAAHWRAPYEEQYGKFVPDSENKAWFARKAPRVLELYTLRDLAKDIGRHDHIVMVIYLARGRHARDGGAAGDSGAWNPYPAGHKRRADFVVTVRKLASSYLDPAESDLLPAAMTRVITLTLRNALARFGEENLLYGYYELLYRQDELETMTLHHWEALTDRVGEKRQNRHSPFVPRPPLW
ncbi:hypothetical protein B0H13DRAFT_2386555 [Mycena leptocephala]|nr:hypothetical protein B0H13DRAFT_2386555 [Mycena leptocephala]